ncbi:MAG: SMC-Scp complex subunit ScpB [Gammaproteobacteria bacterium]|nr:SMC-Scp complex subunit ScpB [Gammaproteobacteria bacterium]
MDSSRIKQIVEAGLMAGARPLDLERITGLFGDDTDAPTREEIGAAIEQLQRDCSGRGYELVRVAGGWRYQVRQELEPWVSRLWEEKPPRYSRALLETLALIVYRQPITRAEIESIRGVAVSSHIVRTLQEREWIRVLGHKDVPGRPALYGSTKRFLDDFGLRSLDDLPTLADPVDPDRHDPQFQLGDLEQAMPTGEGDSADSETEDGESPASPEAEGLVDGEGETLRGSPEPTPLPEIGATDPPP